LVENYGMPIADVARTALISTSGSSFNKTQKGSRPLFTRFRDLVVPLFGRGSSARLSQRTVGGMAEKLQTWHIGFMSKPALNISELTPEERLRLIEELWDSLSEMPDAVPLTDAQREELDRRLDDLEHSGPQGIPWDQVLQQIRSRSR
jgi:putative addiction module component (TIGR02574 family)